MQASVILNKVAQILSDTGFTQWKETELIGYLNSAIRLICVYRPDACTVLKDVSLVVGYVQTIDGLRFVDAFHNGTMANPGDAVEVVSLRERDSIDRSWRSDIAATTILEVMYDDNYPDKYFVSPPANADSRLVISQTETPAELTANTDTLPIADTYEPHLIEWVLYLAFSRDATGVYASSAISHQNTFGAMMGVTFQSDGQLNMAKNGDS